MRKKAILISLILIVAVLLAGCRKEGPATSSSSAVTGTSSDNATTQSQTKKTDGQSTSGSTSSSEPTQTSSGQNDPEPVLGFHVDAQKTSKDYEQGDEPVLTVEISVPQVAETEVSSYTAARRINSYYTKKANELASYAEDVLYESAAAEHERCLESGAQFKPFSLEASFSCARNDEKVFSVRREAYESTGDAEQNYTLKAENFICSSGALLTMDSLFKVPFDQYSERIKELVLAEIKTRFSFSADIESTLMSAYDYSDFLLTENGVCFIWQPYSIHSKIDSVQIFEFTYDELADVIDEQWMN